MEINIQFPEDLKKLIGWTICEVAYIPNDAGIEFVISHPAAEKRVKITLTPQSQLSANIGKNQMVITNTREIRINVNIPEGEAVKVIRYCYRRRVLVEYLGQKVLTMLWCLK